MYSSTPARVIECLTVFPLYSNKSFEFRARLSMILCISKKKNIFSSTSEAPISELRWNLGTNLVSGSNYTVRRLDWKRFQKVLKTFSPSVSRVQLFFTIFPVFGVTLDPTTMYASEILEKIGHMKASPKKRFLLTFFCNSRL